MIKNTVAQNSYRGGLFTDEGPWSHRTTKITGKHHNLCSKHKANGLFMLMLGLSGLISHYIEDMNTLVYEVFHSKVELDKKVEEALNRYGHSKKSYGFIESICTTNDKLCASYT